MATKSRLQSSPITGLEQNDTDALEDEFEYGFLGRRDEEILDLSFLEDSDLESFMGDSELESVINSVDGNLIMGGHPNYEDSSY